MAPRRRCPVCRSRQWHKEPSSGLIACSEGHILQDYRNETVEMQEMPGPHAMHKRALKSGRKTKTDADKIGRSNPELYHGPRGTFLYFQCLQLILRKQVAALTQLWHLPAEFELVCRDVWALNLSLLPQHPPPEPYYFSHGENTVNDESEPVPKDEEGNGEPLSDDDPIIAALQADTSSDEDEVSDSSNTSPKVETSKRRDQSKFRSMTSTIAVLALTCWMLRIPIMYSDLIRAIDAYDLPYLDAVKYLPSSMVSHLTKHNTWALSMQRPPRIQAIHKLTARIGKQVYERYGILTPELNAAPLLWRVTTFLGGTPTLYQLTKQLLRILELPLTVSYALSPSLERTKKKDPDHHAYDHIPPELGFVAGTIVMLKMVYGLDGIERVPADPGDPAAALPRIDEFMDTVRKMNDKESENLQELFGCESAMLVGNLNEDALAEYVKFCEKALLGDQEEDVMIRKYFPMDKSSAEEVTKEHERMGVSGVMRATSLDENDNVRPGQKYKIYIGTDSSGSVAPELEELVGRGARMIKVGGEEIFQVMEQYERGLLRWWKKQRNKGTTRARKRSTPVT